MCVCVCVDAENSPLSTNIGGSNGKVQFLSFLKGLLTEFSKKVRKVREYGQNIQNLMKMKYLTNVVIEILSIRRRGVVGRVPAFQLGDPGMIPGGFRNFNFCPGIGCVSFVFCPLLSPAEALALC